MTELPRRPPARQSRSHRALAILALSVPLAAWLPGPMVLAEGAAGPERVAPVAPARDDAPAGDDAPAPDVLDLSRRFLDEPSGMADPEAARRTAAEALDRAEATGSRHDLALADFLQGQVHAFAGEPQQAEARYRASRETYAALGDPGGEALALQGIAGLALGRGRDDVAMRLLQQATALFARAEEPFGQASAQTQLGRLAADSGDAAGAAEHFRTAAGLYRQAKQPAGIGRALLDLAGLHSGAGEEAAAREDLAAAQAAFVEAGELRGQAAAALQLGRIDLAAGNGPAAAMQIRAALDLFRQAGDPRGEAETMLLLGQAAQQRGEVAASLDAFDDAVRLYRAARDAAGMAYALVERAELQAARDPEAAIEDYDLAAQLFAALGMAAQEMYCREAMTVAKSLRGR